jgi:hypothetical protein
MAINEDRKNKCDVKCTWEMEEKAINLRNDFTQMNKFTFEI